MTSAESKFFELLRVALGTQKELTSTISLEEWDEIAEIAAKQCVMGMLYSAIELLPKGQRPPNNILLAIHERVEEIEERNRYMNKLTYAASKRFEVDGFPNCVLKGQGIATLYPNPLRRESGDIDIWVKGEREDIINYVNKVSFSKPEEATYMHIGFDLKDGTPVEAHFRPSFSFNPFVNKKMQVWFKECQSTLASHYEKLPDLEHEIPTPTLQLNFIYILHHIYRHFLNIGIGFRQIIDYFYVFSTFNEQSDESAKNEAKELLKRFKMDKFFEAISWIFVHLFGYDSSKLWIKPNEKEGQILLSEILEGGNFGKYREEEIKNKTGFWLSSMWRHQKRRWHFVKAYHNEIIWHFLQACYSAPSIFIHQLKKEK